MAPHPPMKGTAEERGRIKNGLDAHTTLWNNHVQFAGYVLAEPGSQLVCKYCFSTTDDIAQHTNKQSACAMYMGIKHLKYCYQENSFGDPPNFDVCAAMLRDTTCPVNPRDIIIQGHTWDPTTNFTNNGEHRYGHTCDAVLTATSFQTLYEDYCTAHTEFDGCGEIPDLFSKAAEKATGIHNFPLILKRLHKNSCERYVREEIMAGRLQRTADIAAAAAATTAANAAAIATAAREMAENYIVEEIRAGRLQRPAASPAAAGPPAPAGPAGPQ